MKNNIKKLRLAAKMSQNDLSLKLGIDRTTVTKWELNSANPRTDKLPLLAKVLNCSIEDLFETEKVG